VTVPVTLQLDEARLDAEHAQNPTGRVEDRARVLNHRRTAGQVHLGVQCTAAALSLENERDFAVCESLADEVLGMQGRNGVRTRLRHHLHDTGIDRAQQQKVRPAQVGRDRHPQRNVAETP